MGVTDLMVTARGRYIDNGDKEHGPLKLHVPKLHRNLEEALPEVEVEHILERRLHQTLPDAHYLFWPVEPV